MYKLKEGKIYCNGSMCGGSELLGNSIVVVVKRDEAYCGQACLKDIQERINKRKRVADRISFNFLESPRGTLLRILEESY
jgi:hypothetical protein